MLRTLLRRFGILSVWAKFTVRGMMAARPLEYDRQARHLRYNMHIDRFPVYNRYVRDREKLNLRPIRGAPPSWAEGRARSRMPLP